MIGVAGGSTVRLKLRIFGDIQLVWQHEGCNRLRDGYRKHGDLAANGK